MNPTRFRIGPIGDGLRKDLKPAFIMEQAFATLTNAHQFRGRIVRRSGYTLLGRLANNTPVMGLRTRELFLLGLQQLIAFDTVESYDYNSSTLLFEPLPSVMPTIWSGTDFDFFFTTNYAGAFWATNFNPGLHGFAITAFAGQAGSGPWTVQVTSPGNTFQVGDNVYFLNVSGTGAANNLIFGIVTVAGNPFTVTATVGGPFTNAAGITGFAVGSTANFAYSISGINNANPAQVTTSTAHGFTTGNQITIIDVVGYTPILASTPQINGRTFTIIVTGATTFTLNGLNGALYGVYGSGGIAGLGGTSGQDGIRYYGQLTIGTSWANYNPPVDPNNALLGCLLIFPYRGYLVFLNTWEGNQETGPINYGGRARWTQIGTPYYSEPVPTTPTPQSPDPLAVRDDLFGRGGADDAPTQEVIIGAAFIRDLLVVYFERSTWRLRFVNNAQNPFVWERVNVELGSSSTFSCIPFDKGLMTIGNRGILNSDGNDTLRFDEKIPDDIFNIRQSQAGLQRVYGIRTFRTKLCYWTYPDAENVTGIYPDKTLVYNYETQTWSYTDDCFTCFGYYYPNTSNLGDRWIDLDRPWSEYNDRTCEVVTQHSGLETVIAGNQQGFIFQLEQTSSQNSVSLFILSIAGDLLNSPNNNLPVGTPENNFQDGTWIKLSGITGTTSSDGVSLNGRNFKISNNTLDPNTFSLQEFASIQGPFANGASYSTIINYVPILAGSVQINIGALVFTDPLLDGNLFTAIPTTFGTINYKTGKITLTFNPPLGGPTAVYIRVVSIDAEQILVPVNLTGMYGGGGLITKISNVNILTKIFNFLKSDKGARLSRIDFYMNLTENGQFTCNVFADSSNVPVNVPLNDNPQSNIVLTSSNPYQIGSGDETIFRLFADCTAQTLQLQCTLSDRQMAVDAINSEDIDLLDMIFTLKQRSRLV